MARIFLCHSSEDKPQVRNVYKRLKALGFEPWLDEEEILPGQDWDYEIETALETSDFVLVFLSERSVDKTGYVQREFRRALYHSEEIPEGRIHTIPVKLDDCTVPRRFIRHQWVNLNDEGAFDRIVRALKLGLEQRGLSIPDGPVAPSTSSSVPLPALEPQSSFTNSIGMELILIPAGEFVMGTPKDQVDAIGGGDERFPNRMENESPQHQVVISQPFYLGKYPVTQAQWQAVMGNNPSDFQGADRPVENVSWKEAQDFMEKLNEREGVRRYRLPTEAQWEYACRAGSSTLYHFSDDEARLGEYAWYRENSGDQTHPVGQKKPNDWGLYDMHGNVFEWLQDWYDKDYYRKSPTTDPRGPDAGAGRVIRGGVWGGGALHARAAYRNWLDPGYRYQNFGFRCLSSGREPVSGADLCRASLDFPRPDRCGEVP